MRITQIGAATVLSLCAGTTQAASLDFTDSLQIAGLGVSETELFAPRFDPHLGTLNVVHLLLTATTTLDAGIENLEPFEVTTLLTLGNNVFAIADDAPTAFVEADPRTVETLTLGAFDGTTDFDGASGQSFSGISLTDSTGNSFTDADVLAAFTGRGETRFTTEATNQVDAVGASRFAGDVAISSLGLTDVTLSVRYDFTPPVAAVPLPASMALLGLALGGLGLARRRNDSALRKT